MPRAELTTEQTAIWLYAVLARDFEDFFEFVNEAKDEEALKLLYLMLTVPNKKHDKSTVELNKIGAGFVERNLKNRRLALPEAPYPSRWERLLRPEDYDGDG